LTWVACLTAAASFAATSPYAGAKAFGRAIRINRAQAFERARGCFVRTPYHPLRALFSDLMEN